MQYDLAYSFSYIAWFGKRNLDFILENCYKVIQETVRLPYGKPSVDGGYDHSIPRIPWIKGTEPGIAQEVLDFIEAHLHGDGKGK